MWELLQYIVQYILSNGGSWGLLLLIISALFVYLEYNRSKSNKNLDKVSENLKELSDLVLKDSSIIIEINKSIDKLILSTDNADKLSSQKYDKLIRDIKDFSKQTKVDSERVFDDIENFISVSNENNLKIEKLNEQLQDLNDDRVTELKELLSKYHDTMNELSLALQKMTFLIKANYKE